MHRARRTINKRPALAIRAAVAVPVAHRCQSTSPACREADAGLWLAATFESSMTQSTLGQGLY